MKYEIKNRWTGAVQFTAEIKCAEDASEGIKLGLAVRAAVSAGANLANANLANANLADAYLVGANLANANLANANLVGANLENANLARASLENAYLVGANLENAYLARANIRDGVAITRAPISVHGLAWAVVIYDHHMQIGCEFHSHDEWRGFSREDWIRMGGKEAGRLLEQHFPALDFLCAAHAKADGAEEERVTEEAAS